MALFVEVLPHKQDLLSRALAVMKTEISRSLAARGQCAIALAGGSTPKPLYEALAQLDLPWSKIHIFWGDERYVPADHPDSNQRMAREAWLDHVDFPPENIHPMATTSNDPAQDAQIHEGQLQEFFATAPGEFPAFDLVLLGIGDDAHTASLFPHTAALSVGDRLVTVGEKQGEPRLTFTIPLINQARCVIFLVSGDSKRPALARIFAPEASHLDFPARAIKPQGDLWWFMDQAAGSELKARP